MTGPRRKFTREFKREAVRQVLDQGKSQAAKTPSPLGRELGREMLAAGRLDEPCRSRNKIAALLEVAARALADGLI